MTRDQEDKMYMKIAQIVAEQSYCVKRKVGAIIVKNDTIIGMGFNGTPSGRDNCCEVPVDHSYGLKSFTKSGLITKPEVLHAESNAIAKVACSTLSSVGSRLYVTCSPCMECAKLIIQSKISEVIYLTEYSSMEGVELMKSIGIKVKHLQLE